MENQQRLETNGIEQREKLVARNKYYRGEGEIDLSSQYNSEHPDAISDGDPLGKGNGSSMTAAPNPGTVNSKAITYNNVNTKSGGGSYDIKGRNGVGGREWAMARNLYSTNEQYGPESVDMSANIAQGQYIVK